MGKRIVSWYQFGTMFGNLGKLVAEINQFCRYTPVVFLRIFSYSNVFIDIDGYKDKLMCILNHCV